MMRSAKIASISDRLIPLTATRIEKKAVVLNEAKYPGSSKSALKLSKPTHSFEKPKVSCIWNDCTSAWPAGQKKKTLMMASRGARSTHGSHAERKRTRFSMSRLLERVVHFGVPTKAGIRPGGQKDNPPPQQTGWFTGAAGLRYRPAQRLGRYQQTLVRTYLFARAKPASCSLPRATAVSK